MGKKILVAGGTGVIGSQFVKQLAKVSKNIHVVAHEKKEFIKRRIPPGVKYTKLDLRKPNDCDIATNKIDIVINAVGIKAQQELEKLKFLTFTMIC